MNEMLRTLPEALSLERAGLPFPRPPSPQHSHLGSATASPVTSHDSGRSRKQPHAAMVGVVVSFRLASTC